MNVASRALVTGVLATLLSTSALAQVAPAALEPPVAATPSGLVLHAGTEVPLKTVRELSSKTNRQGDRFDLEVADDVRVDGVVVIPRGSRGVGEITRLVKKGAFGKSGKLETQALYVTVGNQQVRLDGTAGDRGKSGTAGTVAAVVLVGIFSAFVTGTSAVLPVGSTLVGYVESDLPIAMAAAPAPLVLPAAAPTAIATPAPLAAPAGGQ